MPAPVARSMSRRRTRRGARRRRVAAAKRESSAARAELAGHARLGSARPSATRRGLCPGGAAELERFADRSRIIPSMPRRSRRSPRARRREHRLEVARRPGLAIEVTASSIDVTHPTRRRSHRRLRRPRRSSFRCSRIVGDQLRAARAETAAARSSARRRVDASSPASSSPRIGAGRRRPSASASLERDVLPAQQRATQLAATGVSRRCARSLDGAAGDARSARRSTPSSRTRASTRRSRGKRARDCRRNRGQSCALSWLLVLAIGCGNAADRQSDKRRAGERDVQAGDDRDVDDVDRGQRRDRATAEARRA